MSGRYTADGRRRSSMTHATRGHPCEFCDFVPFGNGGVVSHGRRHVRRGEAVEVVKFYPDQGDSRFFVAPDAVPRWIERGYGVVQP